MTVDILGVNDFHMIALQVGNDSQRSSNVWLKTYQVGKAERLVGSNQ